MSKKRLIDATDLVRRVLEERDKIRLEVVPRYGFGVPVPDQHGQAMVGGIRKALREIETSPTVDAVEVVRCKDCKFSIPVYQKNGSALEGTLHCLHGRGYQMNAPDREYSFISPNNFCGSGRRKIDAEVHDDA